MTDHILSAECDNCGHWDSHRIHADPADGTSWAECSECGYRWATPLPDTTSPDYHPYSSPVEQRRRVGVFKGRLGLSDDDYAALNARAWSSFTKAATDLLKTEYKQIR